MSDTREDGGEDPGPGYAWTPEEQETRLPADEYALHQAILDDYDEEDLRALDLSGRNDYILWAAAQAFEDLERNEEALATLRRLAASRAPHPALFYPDILLRLAEHLRDRGDYAETLQVLERVGDGAEEGVRGIVEERRAEVLVLSGDLKKGLWLFEKAAGRAPDDPWCPIAAAWALLQRGEYDRVAEWLERAERALRHAPEDEQARAAASEIDRLRTETEARRRRRPGATAATGPGGGRVDLRGRREAILAAVDAEEVRLVSAPPRDEAARDEAARRLADLHARASRSWDDAVEAGDEEMIAAFDDLQGEIVGLAERFGVPSPDREED
jgi:tetratricopeptide (TPR) repeat protein